MNCSHFPATNEAKSLGLRVRSSGPQKNVKNSAEMLLADKHLHSGVYYNHKTLPRKSAQHFPIFRLKASTKHVTCIGGFRRRLRN